MITKQLQNAGNVVKAFAALEAKVRRKLTREAAKAGGTPTVARLKALVPSETGTAKKAIGSKQKTYRLGSLSLVIIGARAGFKRAITRTVNKKGKVRIKSKRTQEKASAQREVRDPSRYLHLPDGGRKAVKARGKKMPIRTAGGGIVFVRGAKSVKAKNFMRRALESSSGAALAAMEIKFRTGIEAATRQVAAT